VKLSAKNSGKFLLNELPLRVKHKWGCHHRYRLKPIDWQANLYKMVLEDTRSYLQTAGVQKGGLVQIDESGSQEPIRPERHVVLVAPEIHWNTGNIGRTCLAADARLHLIRPLGFSLESREVKRAGLDYWDQVNVSMWESFEELLEGLRPEAGEVAVFSKAGTRPFWGMPAAPCMFLIFVSETHGLSERILARYAEFTFYIPITARTRSLNLSTAAGIALYESLRQSPPFHAWR